MNYTVKGKVEVTDSAYFLCPDFSELYTVRVYGLRFNESDALIDTISVLPDGSFTKAVTTTYTTIVVKLYLSAGSVLLSTSTMFCHHDEIEVNFFVNEATSGGPIYDRIMARIAAATGLDVSDPQVIVNISEAEIRKLSCLLCVNDQVLFRLQRINQLWLDFLMFEDGLPTPYTPYPLAGLACAGLADQQETGRALFFVLGAEKRHLHEVFSFSRAQFEATLQSGINRNEIAASLLTASWLDTLEGCRNAVLFNANHDGAFYEAKLIHLIPDQVLTPSQAESDKSYLLNGTFDSGLDAVIKAGQEASDPRVEPLIPIRTFSEHVLNFAPFLALAMTELESFDPDYFGLAKAGPDLWHDLMPGLSEQYPDQYSESDTPDIDYANDIYASISENVPSARLIYNLEASQLPGRTELAEVFDLNRDFNIREESVVHYFTVVPVDPDVEAGEVDQETFDQLQQVQRCLRLTGENDAVRLSPAEPEARSEGQRLAGLTALITLTNDNPDIYIDSAAGIGATGELPFIQLMGTAEVSPQQAQQIYCNARAVNESNIAAFVDAYQYDRGDGEVEATGSAFLQHFFNLNSLTLPGSALPDEGLPSLDSIFGSMDTCSCSECQSVYSPAAYLTDLLNWLHKDVVCPGLPIRRALDTLKQVASVNRRTDIIHLYLNCENTNTLLPHIDLVNEILTLNLKPRLSGHPAIAESDYVQLQTNKSAEELLTDPEQRSWFEDTQDLLKTVYVPWELPYNVPYAEALALLKNMDKPYHALVRDFSPSALRYKSNAWAGAYLNINPEELGVITSGHSGSALWQNYWGFPTPSDWKIGPFLEGGKFTIAELEGLLAAYYINGASGKIHLNPVEDDPCDVDEYTFSAFSEGAGDRLMRFTRLMRKTGLSVWELDTAISVWGGSGITAGFVVQLASCMAFCDTFGLDFAELMMWGGDAAYRIPYTSAKSAYFTGKFTNPLLPAAVREFFGTTATMNYTVCNISSDLSAQRKQFLCTVFGISLPALDTILLRLRATVSPPLSGSSTVETILPYLDRYSSLLRTFATDDAEITLSLDLLGDPFLTADVMKSAWDFSEKWSDFRRLDLSLTELKSIAEGTGPYSLVALDQVAETLWMAVEKAFQASRKANPEKLFDENTGLPVEPADQDFFEEVVLSSIGAAFGLETALLRKIIEDHSATWLSSFITNPDDQRNWGTFRSSFVPVYRILTRISVLQAALGMDADGLRSAVAIAIDASLSVPGTPFYWVTDDFSAISATRLSDFIRVYKASLQAGQMDLRQSHTSGYYYYAGDYYASYSTEYTGASPGRIALLYQAMGAESEYRALSEYEFTEIFLRAREIAPGTGDLIAVMAAFSEIVAATRDMQVAPLEAWDWVWSIWSGSFTPATLGYSHSGDIRRAFRSRFRAFKSYSEAIVPVQNQLREGLRDALLAYYIKHQGFRDENSVYGYYLIDPQMSSCMKTSRVVAAISSVQLLVHRALLKLENEVCMDEADKREWEWRKNYRVWEANRKVFLYPENWIDPTLRRDKTVLFTEFEELLLQNELNDTYSEQAYANYLRGLGEVANLDVRAMYVEDAGAQSSRHYRNTPAEILHVFARTWNPPYVYYHRRQVQGQWLGWERIEADIESEHLIPIMFNRRLHLFYPMFIERSFANKPVEGITKPFVRANDSRPYYEIRMCYTKYDFGKWSQKKILNGKLLAGNITFQGLDFNREDRLNFLVAEKPSKVQVKKNQIRTADWFGYWNDVSMKPEDFYFWADIMPDGSLKIHCHRALDPFKRKPNLANTYTEFAIEYSVLVHPADESMSLFPPAADVYADYGSGTYNEEEKPRFLARPYMTMPHFQQMKWGKAFFETRHVLGENGNEISKDLLPPEPGVELFSVDYGLFVKRTISPGSLSDSIKLMNMVQPSVLLYPHQFKHSTKGQPFFFYDGLRNYLFRYERPLATAVNTSNTNHSTS